MNADGTGGGALTRTLTITNQRGLHARAASKFVKLAGTFDARIEVRRGDQSVSGLSIMGLMLLAAAMGTEIEVSTSGPEAEPAMEALAALVDAKFQED